MQDTEDDTVEEQRSAELQSLWAHGTRRGREVAEKLCGYLIVTGTRLAPGLPGEELFDEVARDYVRLWPRSGLTDDGQHLADQDAVDLYCAVTRKLLGSESCAVTRKLLGSESLAVWRCHMVQVVADLVALECWNVAPRPSAERMRGWATRIDTSLELAELAWRNVANHFAVPEKL